MSRYYSAAQYEQDYLPQRLCNWQVNPQLDHKCGTAASKYSTLQQPSKAPIQFLVDDKGHLKPGVKRVNNAFRINLGPADAAPARWPKPNVSIRAAPAATMGFRSCRSSTQSGKPTYDGIVATRLPRPQAGEPSRQAAAAAAPAEPQGRQASA